MPEIKITLSCPCCKYAVDASLKDHISFLVYTCPKCRNNVAYYENKITLISDRMFNKVIRKYNMGTCEIRKEVFSDMEKLQIGDDDILNLKIALATSKDATDFLRKI
jgi:hypothetical protein